MASKSKTVLVLGAGMVTRPLVHYLSNHGINVLVGSRTLEKAEKLIEGAKLAKVFKVDVERDEDLAIVDELTQQSDAVVSMLPYLFHARACEIAIKHKKHFLTTSYVSDAMRALEAKAKEAGVILINECGVDPGTDHMSAMRMMDDVHEKGGKIISFRSFCGGLPAPEDNNNPLGYKFSWAPRGVLLASRNSALYLKDGKEVTIPGEVLFSNYEVEQVGGTEYESYPNRNSTQYLDIYPLRAECHSIIRGTYRNRGWCDAVKKLADLGYLDITERDLSGFASYGKLTSALVGEGDVKEATAKKLNLPVDHKIISTIEWLGLFGNDPLPKTKTHLDALCAAMLSRMQYAPGERDMIVMKHTFVCEFPQEKKRKTYTTELIDFGIKNGDTSMSRTVSYPVAIATRLVLEGKYKHLVGLQLPLTKEFYNPILDELEQLGIKFHDKLVKEENL